MNTKYSAVWSIGFYTAAKILPALLMLAAIPLWARLYGPEEYGLYSITWATALFSSSIAVGWIRQATLRYSGDPALLLENMSQIPLLACSVLSAAPTLIVLAIQASDRDYDHAASLMVTGGLFTILNAWYVVEQGKCQRDERTGAFLVAELLRVATAVLTTVVTHHFGLFTGAVSILLGFTVATAAALVALRVGGRSVTVVSPPANRPLLRIYWDYGWPMGLWLALSALFIYIDRLLISLLISPSEAGTYATLADAIVRGMAMLGFPLTMISYPRIMRLWNGGRGAEALAMTRRYTRYLVVLGGVVTLIGSTIGPRLLFWILGAAPSSPAVVPLLFAGASTWQVALLTHKPLEMTNRTKTMILTLAAVTLLSVTTSILLIPTLGITVPAACFLGGGLAYVAVTYIVARPIRITMAQMVSA